MDPGRMLREARRRAGMTQRELAGRAGVAQPAVARIESGSVIPRVDTLERLLAACGQGLDVTARPGRGVDRSGIRELLALSPRERIELAASDSEGLDRFLEAARIGRP
jgi:transcriptional regulator with XRE-family HTH domain